MTTKNYLKQIKEKLKNRIIIICSSSKAFSNFYYSVLSSDFSREHRSVLAGKAKYLTEIKSDKSSHYLMVRNIHRIEKGLLMRPLRETFALGYIEETMDCFEKQWEENLIKNDGQLKWAYDVLRTYFVVTKNHSIINSEKERFNKITMNLLESNKAELIPYYNKPISNISYQEFFNLTKQRRSTRWFKNDKVPRDLIDKAILAAMQSPSACNRQPFEFRIIDDEKLLKEIVELPMGTAGYAHNIPVMIVVVGNLDAYFSERDRHLIYIDSSLANMALMLAFETLGLSSCPVNWPDIEVREQKMQTLLNLEKYQRPIMCLAVGYPDPEGKVASSKKKDIDKIRFYNA
jgi:nitroreductase